MGPDTFHLKNDATQVVGKMAMESKRLGSPSANADLISRLDKYLDDVSKLHMTPHLRTECKIDRALETICDESKGYRFSEKHTTKAKELLSHFESINWGAPPSPERPREESEDPSEGSEDGTSSVPRKRVGHGPALGDVRLPPNNHPIWGAHGIMHGVAHKKKLTGGFSKVLNPALTHKKVPPNAYGHNGLEVGAWFPFQLVALFNGAHGLPQGGIYYNDQNQGAYSIIVSGGYKDLDHDQGDTLWYSGSGTADNDNPEEPGTRTNGTQALFDSLRTKKPIRVLRSSKGESRWSPTVGIRYDGLYRVVDTLTPRNTKGGLYEQFILKRVDGQRDLAECQRIPSATQVRDFRKINDGY